MIAKNQPRLIVMLTHHDYTIENAEEIFLESRNAPATYWGMKEKGISIGRMKKLYSKMKEYGKSTVLEVVGYTETEGLKGAELAIECGCDILMGTKYHHSIATLCQNHNIKYFPFIGEITGRPSVLQGEISDIIREAKHLSDIGNIAGIDLLGYRFTGNAYTLNCKVVKASHIPVCLAGSIDSLQRLQEVIESKAWGFTIGSALFDHKFGDSIPNQIAAVVNFLTNH